MRTKKAVISEIVPDFKAHLRARGLADRSVKNNIQVLNRWLDLVGDTNVDKINAAELDRFFGAGNWAPKTQNLYLSMLRGTFFPWCRRHGYLSPDADPTDGWKSVRAEHVEQFWLPVEEFPNLLDAAKNPRDRAIIALGLFTFMRGSEINSLRIQDLDLDRSTLNIYRFKTKQADTLPVSEELGDEMRTWLRHYQKMSDFSLQPDWFLAPAYAPLPMQYDPTVGLLQPVGEARLKPTVKMGKPYECVKRALTELGYDTKGTGVHSLRRSGARALFDRLRSEGYDGALRRVSSMLGHADTKTTEIYLGLSLERQQRNELLAGKPMFPALQRKDAKIVPLKEVGSGNGA
jgi:integrase